MGMRFFVAAVILLIMGYMIGFIILAFLATLLLPPTPKDEVSDWGIAGTELKAKRSYWPFSGSNRIRFQGVQA